MTRWEVSIECLGETLEGYLNDKARGRILCDVAADSEALPDRDERERLLVFSRSASV